MIQRRSILFSKIIKKKGRRRRKKEKEEEENQERRGSAIVFNDDVEWDQKLHIATLFLANSTDFSTKDY